MFVKISCVLLCLLSLAGAAGTQAPPRELIGTWVVAHDIPIKADSCWGKEEARKLIGTEIQYSDKIFRWDKTVLENPLAETRSVTAEEFRDENSGAGPKGSQITLLLLGIHSDPVTEVSIRHKPAHVFLETTEIPGDDVVLKSPDTIVFAVCNVYFEAKRVHNKK